MLKKKKDKPKNPTDEVWKHIVPLAKTQEQVRVLTRNPSGIQGWYQSEEGSKCQARHLSPGYWYHSESSDLCLSGISL